MKATRLDPSRAALLIIDFQDRLAAAMNTEVRAQAEHNVGVLLQAARRFSIPVVMSEQYPRGLGATTVVVNDAANALESPPHRFEKVEFSVCDAPGFAPIWDQLGRSQWLVTGMECHVCVHQSVRDLIDRGAEVHVISDAVTSRTPANWTIGIELMRANGAIISSTEVALFELLGKAGSADFKALSPLIR